MQNDNAKLNSMKILQAIKVVIIALVLFSCSENKKQEMYPDLIETVQKIQEGLPLTISEGLILSEVEYEDTLFTLQYEIDEKEFPFENLVKAKQNRKNLFLTTISASEGNERTGFEQCVSYNVSVNFYFIGKRSHKEMSIIVSPYEINDALNTKSNALDVLKIQIEGEKSSLPEKLGDGLTMTNVELRDSMVYTTIELDEKNYSFDGLDENLDEMKTEIRMSLRSDRIGMNLIKMIANVHYGLVYSYVGSVSGKVYNITFSPDEILLEKVIYDAKVKTATEIVECDV